MSEVEGGTAVHDLPALRQLSMAERELDDGTAVHYLSVAVGELSTQTAVNDVPDRVAVALGYISA